jgi:hypothetical protein
VMGRKRHLPSVVSRCVLMKLAATGVSHLDVLAGRVQAARRRKTTRTSDQSERQARGGFLMFAQVSVLGCIDLGDRRSGVQISPATKKLQVRAGPLGPVLRVLSSRSTFYCALGLISAGCPMRPRKYVQIHAWTCPTTRHRSLPRADQRRAGSGDRKTASTVESCPRHAPRRRVGSRSTSSREPRQKLPQTPNLA